MNTTVRIGTLMPTPSVSVPQMTFSRPAWASVSTSRRYFGSMPAWCTPMPWRTRRERVRPNPAVKRKFPIRSAIRSFSARVQTLRLVSAWARSMAAAWVKCTTYTGAWWVLSSSSSVSCNGVVTYENTSGTGRSAACDDCGGTPGAPGQVGLEPADIAERRRHQDELGLREFEERDLPCPASVWFGVEVELVHHDLAHVGPVAAAQGEVGEDLRRAADDRCVGVDARVTGHHADLRRAEHLAEREELLRHERLDRRGVERPSAARQGREVGAGRDQALAGPGRAGKDHVRARDDLDQRLFLVWIEGEALLLGPAGERVEECVGIGVGRLGERCGRSHVRPIVPHALLGVLSSRIDSEGWIWTRCPNRLA